jgi:hypothetical protein
LLHAEIVLQQVTYLKEQISDLQNNPYIFFCKYDDLYVLNKAILYVRQNEQTQRLLVVHVSDDPESLMIKNLSRHIEMFDAIYPRIKVRSATAAAARQCLHRVFNAKLAVLLSAVAFVLYSGRRRHY